MLYSEEMRVLFERLLEIRWFEGMVEIQYFHLLTANLPMSSCPWVYMQELSEAECEVECEAREQLVLGQMREPAFFPMCALQTRKRGSEWLSMDVTEPFEQIWFGNAWFPRRSRERERERERVSPRLLL